MSISAESQFLPIIPDWLLEKCVLRYGDWQDGYMSLAERYCGSPDIYYNGDNISLKTINDYSASTLGDIYYVSGPWMPPESDGSIPWIGNFWSNDTPPPPPGDPELYWGAMCLGLAVWQMYHTLLAEQFVRFYEFGHYGRNPTN